MIPVHRKSSGRPQTSGKIHAILIISPAPVLHSSADETRAVHPRTANMAKGFFRTKRPFYRHRTPGGMEQDEKKNLENLNAQNKTWDRHRRSQCDFFWVVDATRWTKHLAISILLKQTTPSCIKSILRLWVNKGRR